jgi:uracil-DNA glycosylase
MSWTARQRAMLSEMGIRVWDAPAPAAADADAPAASAAAASLMQTAQTTTAAPVVEQVAAAAATSSARPAPNLRSVRVATAAVIDIAREGDQTTPSAATTTTTTATAAVDASALDWPALRSAVASCTACGLAAGRTNTVFGVGHPQAHWMVVGEAPGEEEDRLGEPFVGRSGRLLDNMLRAIGLGRGSDAGADSAADPACQVFIANTLKCRPPGNRNPRPAELAQCEGFLIRQIELVQPKIILAMGAFAVQSLLRSTAPVGQLRGRVHRYHGVPLVVTYHPAYLLRNLGQKARAWEDLCLALDTVQATVADRADRPAGA